MRITYRTLAALIARMTDEQKDSDVTVELIDENGTECFAGELRICSENHDSLDDGHPVLFVNFAEVTGERTDDIDFICEEIGLI